MEKSTSQKANLEIRFLTYNLFMRPIVHSVYDDFKDQRLQHLLSHIHKYDIICFQELFSFINYRPSRMLKFAMNNGFKYIRKSPDPAFHSFSLIDGGLMTLSRFPILGNEFYRFKDAMMSDLLCAKGMLYTKIELPNKIFIHLFNCHTQATYDNNLKCYKENVRVRLEELVELQKFIRETLKKYWKDNEKSSVLIAGDYNVNSRIDGYDEIILQNFQRKDLIIYSNDDKSHFNEYETFLKIFKLFPQNEIYDILELTSSIEKPITYCEANHNEYGELENWDKALTCENEKQNQCLDYFLYLKPNHLASSSKLELNESFTLDCEVIKFEVLNEKFKMLSDHYGVEMRMKIF